MLQSGQYPQPQLRPAVIQEPVVAGYTTIRLQANLQFTGTGTGTIAGGTISSLVDNTVLGLFENVGPTDVTIQIREVGDYTLPASGRGSLGAAFSLVANGGRQTKTFIPLQQYVEIWGVSGGPSNIKVQLNSQVEWGLLAFAKNDPVYPPQLWRPASYNNS